MAGIVQKLSRWMRFVFGRLPDDPRFFIIRDALAATRSSRAGGCGPRVALQSLEDPFYYGLFGAISQRLSETHGATTDLLVVRSTNSAVGYGVRERIFRSTVFVMIVAGKWARAFMDNGSRLAYRSASLVHPLGDLLDWFRSRRLWQRQRSNPDISSLHIRGVCVGDLIIDSYLRFRPAPRFDVTDPFVAQLLWQAHRDIRRARAYFGRRQPSLYITSYTTYVEHGVPTRVALQLGIPVRSFGSLIRFGKPVTPADWFHTPDTSTYRSTFETLDSQSIRLAEAQRQLQTRLSGGIDAATRYMRVSAYAASSEPLPDVSGAVVIFLHDFYDSPHVYADLVFPDFWTWVCFTIDTLQAAGFKVFAKPHPNQIDLSSEVIQKLRARYPALELLSVRASNAQLAAAGMRCGVTVYGTVAHELAYLGIPTIACARHPHHSFDFCRTARSREEYRQLLSSSGELPVPVEEMRRQALAFYYMHNLYADADSRLLQDKYLNFWKLCHDADVPPGTLRTGFDELRRAPAFQAGVDRMLSGPRHADGVLRRDSALSEAVD